MKFSIEDYKKYCKKFGLKESEYTSLARFKRDFETQRETRLIVRHINRLVKVVNKNDIELLGGTR